jgi:hypothetical protein
MSILGVTIPSPGTRQTGGARRDRTADLLHAMQALSQLSYGPGWLACPAKQNLDMAALTTCKTGGRIYVTTPRLSRLSQCFQILYCVCESRQGTFLTNQGDCDIN